MNEPSTPTSLDDPTDETRTERVIKKSLERETPEGQGVSPRERRLETYIFTALGAIVLLAVGAFLHQIGGWAVAGAGLAFAAVILLFAGFPIYLSVGLRKKDQEDVEAKVEEMRREVEEPQGRSSSVGL